MIHMYLGVFSVTVGLSSPPPNAEPTLLGFLEVSKVMAKEDDGPGCRVGGGRLAPKERVVKGPEEAEGAAPVPQGRRQALPHFLRLALSYVPSTFLRLLN